MSSPDLSKLHIDRKAVSGETRRSRPWLRIVLVVALLALAAAWVAHRMTAAPAVETTSVVNAWPAQNYTVLNASGYVVPQRNAALSSKGQGRLE